VANVPRSILTLAPTRVKELMVLKASKRTTTGWRDGDGAFMDYAYFQRTDNPTRPAWIPVGHEEAEEMMGASSQSGSGRAKKATTEHVIELLATGAMKRQFMLESLMKKTGCSESTAKSAIRDAQPKDIVSFTDKDKNTGRNVTFFCLPEHKGQWVKDELTS